MCLDFIVSEQVKYLLKKIFFILCFEKHNKSYILKIVSKLNIKYDMINISNFANIHTLREAKNVLPTKKLSLPAVCWIPMRGTFNSLARFCNPYLLRWKFYLIIKKYSLFYNHHKLTFTSNKIRYFKSIIFTNTEVIRFCASSLVLGSVLTIAFRTKNTSYCLPKQTTLLLIATNWNSHTRERQ